MTNGGIKWGTSVKVLELIRWIKEGRKGTVQFTVYDVDIYWTDEDRVMEDGELLSWHIGYWADDCSKIWIWTGWWLDDIALKSKKLNLIQLFGFTVHELLELWLEGKCGIEHKLAHKISCVIELVITLGWAWPVLFWNQMD